MRDTRATDSTFRPALLLMSGRTLAFVATFFTPVVLARVFDQTEFGTYKQLFLVFSTLYYIAQVGMAESLFYFVPAAGAATGRYVANSLLVLAVMGAACGALLATAGVTIAGWLSNDTLSLHLGPIAAFLALMLGSAGLEIVMTARRRYLAASACYGASDVLRAASLTVPALLLGRLDAVVAGAVVFALVRAAAALGYFGCAFRATLRVDRALLARQLTYAGPFGLAVLLEIVQANFHQYAVAYRFDAATFAVYAVGCLQIPFVDLVAMSAGNVLMVRMAEAVREARADRVLEIWHDATRKLAVVFFPLVGVLLVGAPDLIVLLFTEQYRASVPVFMIATTVIGLAVLATDAVLRVYAQTGFLLLLNAVRLVLIAALIAPLIAVFQLPGAMLVTVLATAVAKCLALARMRGLMGVGLAGLLPWRSLGTTATAATLAALVGLAARSSVGDAGWSGLTAATVATGVVYLALVLRLGLLGETERTALTGWRRRPVADGRVAARSRG
ncbi:MAG: oligosaccharide flippase family protein [Candidatus Rokubacteria bacterium]|nr:oligosaccharide flippase family protein [Candidatus Rokubacteria bacterium]